jgi:5-bromo-4-chloroindolyl phosphate hydrolysis protein
MQCYLQDKDMQVCNGILKIKTCRYAMTKKRSRGYYQINSFVFKKNLDYVLPICKNLYEVNIKLSEGKKITYVRVIDAKKKSCSR